MKSRTLLIALRALSLVCAPLAGSAAGAAAPDTPKPTLVRLEMTPLDAPSAATLATEHCVAAVKAGDFAAAGHSCDSAVSAAIRERSAAPFSGRDSDAAVAATYNNRAVLRYLSGRLELAAADANRAKFAARSRAIDDTAAAIDAALRRGAARGE